MTEGACSSIYQPAFTAEYLENVHGDPGCDGSQAIDISVLSSLFTSCAQKWLRIPAVL